MGKIQELMESDHRRCDELLAEAERAVERADVEAAAAAFGRFRQATLDHFAGEEKILFPAFEDRSGMRFGPTEIMRQEHTQMRDLMTSAAQALALNDLDAYCVEMEMLVILMQQHNMKEENILYPMCDRHFAGDTGPMLATLESAIAGDKVIA